MNFDKCSYTGICEVWLDEELLSYKGFNYLLATTDEENINQYLQEKIFSDQPFLSAKKVELIEDLKTIRMLRTIKAIIVFENGKDGETLCFYPVSKEGETFCFESDEFKFNALIEDILPYSDILLLKIMSKRGKAKATVEKFNELANKLIVENPLIKKAFDELFSDDDEIIQKRKLQYKESEAKILALVENIKDANLQSIEDFTNCFLNEGYYIIIEDATIQIIDKATNVKVCIESFKFEQQEESFSIERLQKMLTANYIANQNQYYCNVLRGKKIENFLISDFTTYHLLPSRKESEKSNIGEPEGNEVNKDKGNYAHENLPVSEIETLTPSEMPKTELIDKSTEYPIDVIVSNELFESSPTNEPFNDIIQNNILKITKNLQETDILQALIQIEASLEVKLKLKGTNDTIALEKHLEQVQEALLIFQEKYEKSENSKGIRLENISNKIVEVFLNNNNDADVFNAILEVFTDVTGEENEEVQAT